MPLAALIIVESSAEPLVLGRSAAEITMRRLHATGSSHIVLLVERVSQALLASVDRMRRDGATVDVARTVTDAAERFHPEERVLLVASSRLLGSGQFTALATAKVPMLLATENSAANAAFELIDASSRWTGFALLDGAILRKTAAMVGDWDFGSTLLRQMNVAGAGRIMLSPEDAKRDLVDPVGSAPTLATALLQAVVRPATGFGDALIVRPASRLLARAAGEARIGGRLIELGGTGLALGALVGVLYGWIAAPLAVFVVALVVLGTGDLLEAATSGRQRGGRFFDMILPAASAAIALGIARTLWTLSGQWGYPVLGIALVLALSAADADSPRIWSADAAGLAIIVLLGASLGLAGPTFVLAAAYALGSRLWQHRTAAILVARSGLARS